MPPPVEDLSDEEAGDIPYSNDKDEVKETVEGNGEEKDDENSEDDEEEDVYIVEKITDHNFSNTGTLLLHVKWKGYEKAADMTWEPEDGLMEGAEEVVQEYYKKIGGRPDKPSSKPAGKPGPGRKRKSMGESKETKSTKRRASQTEPKRQRKPAGRTPASETPALTEDNSDEDNENWLPKGNNWDKEVHCVDTIVRGEGNDKSLFALLLWTNGKKTRVPVETCYEKCPKKMLKFYEQHLVFKDG